MADTNTINYAEKWAPKLLPLIVDDSYTSMFLANTNGPEGTNDIVVDPMDAKTFHFTSMAVGNLKTHVKGSYNAASVTQTDHPYYLDLDIDGRYEIDSKDVMQSNQTASIQNVAEVVTRTKAVPTIDARFFHQVAKTCNANSRFEIKTAADIETAGATAAVKSAIKHCKLYRANRSLVVFVNSDIMDAIEVEMLAKGRTNWVSDTTISDSGLGITTRVGSIDGVPIMEVINDERFYTVFTFTDGFTATGSKINILVASRQIVKTVPLIHEMKFFSPETNQLSRGWALDYSICADTFVFPNGATGVYDGVWLVKEEAEA